MPELIATEHLARQRTVRQIFRLLFKHFGAQRWWPATSPLEIMVGAIFTQNTA